MPTGTIKTYDSTRGFGFIKTDGGADSDIFFHCSALREGDEIAEGKAVRFELGTDKRSGRTRAVVVDAV